MLSPIVTALIAVSIAQHIQRTHGKRSQFVNYNEEMKSGTQNQTTPTISQKVCCTFHKVAWRHVLGMPMPTLTFLVPALLQIQCYIWSHLCLNHTQIKMQK